MKPRKLGKAVAVVADFAAPVALFYGLRAAGVGLYATLLVSAALPAAVALIRLVRSRRVDQLAVYTVTMMTLSTAVSLIAGSPRFLLARDAWLTGVTGAWFIVSARTARPLALLYTRPLLERRRIPRHVPDDRSRDWDQLWARLPAFRRVWRVGSVLWGIALLADAVVRVVMAYSLPVDAVPALNTVLYVVTTLLLIVVTNVYYAISGLYDGRSALYAPLAADPAAPSATPGSPATAPAAHANTGGLPDRSGG